MSNKRKVYVVTAYCNSKSYDRDSRVYDVFEDRRDAENLIWDDLKCDYGYLKDHKKEWEDFRFKEFPSWPQVINKLESEFSRGHIIGLSDHNFKIEKKTIIPVNKKY